MQKILSPAHQAFLDSITAKNRALYGGWFMEETEEQKAEREAAEKKEADKKAAEEAAKKFEPITSQEQLDKLVGSRVAREREKYADYDAIKKERDDLKAAGQTESEKALAAAREEGKAEVQTVANARLVNSEARALAAEAGFRNPGIAVSSIDLTKVTVDADGKVDADAIKVKLGDLAESDPYLVKGNEEETKPGRRKPDPSQGGGGKGSENSGTVAAGSDLWEQRRGSKKTAAAEAS